MRIEPDFDAFARRFEAGENQVLWTTLPADLDTPVSLMLKLAQARRDSFMLESVTGGDTRGRYSFIGFKPDLVWRCRDGRAEINRAARYDPHAFEADPRDALTSLRAVLEESQIDLPRALPPGVSGLFGYLGYDMVRLVERLPDVNPDPLGLPDAVMMRPTIVAAVDAVKDEVTIVTPVWAGSGENARAAYARAAERLSDVVMDLDRAVAHETAAPGAAPGEPVSNTGRARYLQMVEKAREYIRAGDIFQVVPSQRWTLDFPLPPFALYRALRRTNPSPYMFFFNFGDFQIVGASPEILVRVRDGKVTIRPIAGTRPRGATPEEDEALRKDLLSDPKELAEHLMLLDLGRNDVGRVARIGTVNPNQQFTVELYSHVMHIVSNVEGALREDVDALGALLAGLPAGTVSGAPKVRAMEIIDELEVHKRGVYAGAVGYISSAQEMDTCIALRTAVIKDGKMHVQAGGGVVHDSDPEAEHQETVNKAKALMRAAQEAARFAGRGGN
ncbi:anthranilate synthase component I [Oceanicella actignis]|uniref:Anthranilate synthase component 1 n=1 Tax=Oceanicella actignis TaxID=1189325 RepID=A0A1M7RX79_9RHOB|nr:anthranilate synthase component I [Oceanicella actignis]SES99058.1 anthranilate synthase, component I [Oceanicella actignis]SHN50786.1 anthranilate synthase component 1 [Oceanicella actignis]